MRLVIFSSVSQFNQAQITAHAGFVKEVDIWASIFKDILIVGIRDEGTPYEDAIPYAAENIDFLWLDHKIKTDGVKGKLLLLFKYPFWIIKSLISLEKDDILMARGPDSIGFLGVILAKITRLPHFAKYADQWQNFENEPMGYRIQKMFYRSSAFGGPVQIYGVADRLHPHLIPFFTSSVSIKDWQIAGKMSMNRKYDLPFKLIFVGRLVKAKGVDIILKAVKILKQDGYEVVLEIVGDGPEQNNLINFTHQLNILPMVTFTGRLGWQDLRNKYASSNCFIHTSRKEGFGKVLIEAMSFGLPIIGTDVGVSRELLSPPRFGIVIPPNDPVALASQIKKIINDYQNFAIMGNNARQQVRNYLLENVEQQYREFSKKYLGTDNQ